MGEIASLDPTILTGEAAKNVRTTASYNWWHGEEGEHNTCGRSIPKNEVKGRLLLDVVIIQCPTILELLASEDKTLLIWGNAELE